MVLIRTKDNRFGANGLLFKRSAGDGEWENGTGGSITAAELEVLKQYSGKSVSEFPSGVVQLAARNVNEDNQVSSQKQWLYVLKEVSDGFRLDTGNMMGVVRLYSADRKTGVQLEISSRFDEGDNQRFLMRMLRVGLGVDIAEEVSAERESGWDFLLACLFVSRLGEVLPVGLLKQYRSDRMNDFNPRGRIDVARHLRQNWPVLSGIAYTKTGSSFDIPVNHLIRHAAERIERKWPGIFAEQSGASEMLRALRENTPTWASGQCTRVLQERECIAPVRHPYFATFYEPLRCLARLILQDEGASLRSSRESASGVLFNGADLWEEYLNMLLMKLHRREGSYFAGGELVHANNRKRSDRICLYRPRGGAKARQPIYPDFRWRVEDGHHEEHEWDCILDAKYKGLVKDSGLGEDGIDCAPGVSLGDRCEMAQYVMATKARLCVLMCPMKESERHEVFAEASANRESPWKESSDGCEWYVDGIFHGHEAKVIVVPMIIPQSDSAMQSDVYAEMIDKSESRFVETIEAAVKGIRLS